MRKLRREFELEDLLPAADVRAVIMGHTDLVVLGVDPAKRLTGVATVILRNRVGLLDYDGANGGTIKGLLGEEGRRSRVALVATGLLRGPACERRVQALDVIDALLLAVNARTERLLVAVEDQYLGVNPATMKALVIAREEWVNAARARRVESVVVAASSWQAHVIGAHRSTKRAERKQMAGWALQQRFRLREDQVPGADECDAACIALYAAGDYELRRRK